MPRYEQTDQIVIADQAPSAQAQNEVTQARTAGNTTTDSAAASSQLVQKGILPELSIVADSSAGSQGAADGSAATIAQNAQNDLGQKLWGNYAKDTVNGEYGCAASVSKVLEDSGYSYADSPVVYTLQQQLKNQGWTPTNTPEPGDVVFGYRTDPSNSTGSGAHTGIVGPDDTVYNNVSPGETWQQTPLSDWNSDKFPAGVIYYHNPVDGEQKPPPSPA